MAPAGGGGGAARKRASLKAARPPKPPSHAPREAVDSTGAPYVVRDDLVVSAGGSMAPWHPNTETSAKLLGSVRLSAALWSSLSDCDETFNYWEPAHFMLYGSGFQTWEYSPEFALRSYLYVLVHALPAWVFDRLTGSHRMYVFYFLRCLLAFVCTAAELYFVTGIKRELGVNVARLTLAVSLLSYGFFMASPAFLPSTTSMYLTMLAYGAWFRRKHALATFFVAISALLSWPFAALTGVPIAADILRRGHVIGFAKWCAVSAAVVLLPMAAIESQYYGRPVLPTANIVLYNVFTSHGPDLYGVEDWKFYFLNGFLNFNVVFPLALAAWPLQALASKLVPSRPGYPGDIPRWMLLLALYLWLAVFISQPHKEERFLFPVYPLVALAASLSVDCLQRLAFRLFVRVQNRHYLDHTNWLSVAVLLTSAVLGLSRLAAVHFNYGGATWAWMHLSHVPLADDYVAPSAPGGPVHVCVGKEWHRFPASFFLPNDEWELKYLRSEFRGQLPQPYLKGVNATRVVRDTFNDLNKEEENRYEISVEECHYLVDLDTGRETPLEPRYSLDTDRWDKVAGFPFLDAGSAGCGLLKSFYVPFVSSKHCRYSDYQVLKNRRPVARKKEEVDKAKAKKPKKKIRHL